MHPVCAKIMLTCLQNLEKDLFDARQDHILALIIGFLCLKTAEYHVLDLGH